MRRLSVWQIFNNSQKRLGFTLIELLIAVSISTIVISMGIVRYRDFNLTQTLKSSGATFKNDLRDIQVKALAAVKPSDCNILTDTLDGYLVEYSTNKTFKATPVCSGTPLTNYTKTYTLGENIEFLTAFSDFSFLALGQGVDNDTTIRLRNVVNNTCYQIRVSASGAIIDTGMITCPAVPTPTPVAASATPSPSPTASPVSSPSPSPSPSPTPTPASVNYALRFDGIDDYVNAGSHSSLDNRNPMTIEAWIRPLGWGENDYGCIVSKTSTGVSPINVFALNNAADPFSSSIQYFRDRATTDLHLVTAIGLNQWRHVAIVINTALNRADIYINGVEQSYALEQIGSGSLTLDESYNLIIGNRINQDITFNGIIDEVRIWNIARSQLNIQTDMNHEFTTIPPGLVGYWQFDETSGNVAYDATTNHNDGTINGATRVAGYPFP